jgi:hypothetical protein
MTKLPPTQELFWGNSEGGYDLSGRSVEIAILYDAH